MKLSDLADERPPPEVKGPRCTVARIVAKVDDADRAVLAGWLADADAYPVAWIAEQLRTVGHWITPATVARHRRGACSCEARANG